MNELEHALQGAPEHKLDPKCRVSVPSDWRMFLANGQIRLLQSSCYGVKTLRVLTESEYARMLQAVDDMEDLTHLQKNKLKGRLHSECQRATISDQGKLTIPKAWCETPGLEPGGLVKLVGRGTYFEIFNLENYDEMRKHEIAETEALDAKLGFF